MAKILIENGSLLMYVTNIMFQKIDNIVILEFKILGFYTIFF